MHGAGFERKYVRRLRKKMGESMRMLKRTSDDMPMEEEEHKGLFHGYLVV